MIGSSPDIIPLLRKLRAVISWRMHLKWLFHVVLVLILKAIIIIVSVNASMLWVCFRTIATENFSHQITFLWKGQTLWILKKKLRHITTLNHLLKGNKNCNVGWCWGTKKWVLHQAFWFWISWNISWLTSQTGSFQQQTLKSLNLSNTHKTHHRVRLGFWISLIGIEKKLVVLVIKLFINNVNRNVTWLKLNL